MAKYKIVGQDKDQIRVVNDDGSITTFNQTSWQYEQFVADVVGIGTSCVEGADVITTTSYDQARASEYPSLEEQQDMQYWDAVNGTTTWKDKIAEIKAKYPKSQVGVVTTSVPDWVIDLTT
tara:strand:- start:53 stop:415 length:363 start_codon:yes stop_codon:yes gene_type:complete